VLAAANGGYGFAEGTFAGTHRNEQDAPVPVVPRNSIRSGPPFVPSPRGQFTPHS
jgi:hypothetical protein